MTRMWIAALGLTAVGAAVALAGESTGDKTKKAQSVYAFTVQDIDGKNVSLSDYKGKVCLIVNVASQ